MSFLAFAQARLGEPATRRTGASMRRRIPASTLAFAALLLLGVVIVLIETRGLSFYGDEWEFLLDRRGLSLDVLLRPHGPHLSLVPVIVYKLLLAVFGGRSYLPFRLLAALDVVLIGLAVGLAVRARWGVWWGLVPVLLLVTLGPGGSSLLWPFQSGYAIAVASGVTALMALDRGGRRADGVACGALLISLASASQGVGFCAGAAVILVLRADPRRRAWTVLLPAALYALWYLRYGQQASETHLSLWKASLPYAMQSLSATLAGLSGLSSVSTQTGLLDPTFGVPAAVVAVMALGGACARGWRPPVMFWAGTTTLLALWVAASLSNTAQIPRPPSDPRYLSSNAAILLLCVASAFPRPRFAGRAALLVVVGLAAVAATNFSQFSASRAALVSATRASRADLGALAILRGVAAPLFSPEQPGDPGVVVNVQARPFYSAADSFGLTFDSPAQLGRLNESGRERVDRILAGGELRFVPEAHGTPLGAAAAPRLLSGRGRVAGGCLRLSGDPVTIQVPAGQLSLTATGGPLSVSLGRFATAYPVPLGPLAPHAVARLTIPPDRAPGVGWRMLLHGPGAQVCRG